MKNSIPHFKSRFLVGEQEDVALSPPLEEQKGLTKGYHDMGT
jgi:hypothetical protein